MQEPIDETDGTPEWAKRFFRRAENWRPVLGVVLFAVVMPIMSLYQAYSAFSSGEVWRFGTRSSRVVTYAEDPVQFGIGLAVAVVMLMVWVVAIAMYHRVRKIPERFKKPVR
jgi:hypothetical protein